MTARSEILEKQAAAYADKTMEIHGFLMAGSTLKDALERAYLQGAFAGLDTAQKIYSNEAP